MFSRCNDYGTLLRTRDFEDRQLSSKSHLKDLTGHVGGTHLSRDLQGGCTGKPPGGRAP